MHPQPWIACFLKFEDLFVFSFVCFLKAAPCCQVEQSKELRVESGQPPNPK